MDEDDKPTNPPTDQPGFKIAPEVQALLDRHRRAKDMDLLIAAQIDPRIDELWAQFDKQPAYMIRVAEYLEGAASAIRHEMEEQKRKARDEKRTRTNGTSDH